MLVQKIISGGQTGVDRAALDVALELGIPCGGWCPRGRLAEDGKISERYPLQETATADPGTRTELNVIQSDGTLVLTWGKPTGGTLLTLVCARHHRKPMMEVDLGDPMDLHPIRGWITSQALQTLNIGGPRESYDPGFIYDRAKKLLLPLF
ncbi:MAG: putative molybdenum carrier protein [Terriglobia bacterium]